jgi:phospholipid transport system substrate-binding protein
MVRAAVIGGIIALSVLILGPAPGHAGPWPDGRLDPRAPLQAAADRLQGVLHGQRDLASGDPGRLYRVADQVLMPLVDMDRVSSLVLGRQWRSASTAQKAAFAEQLKRLLVRTYATALREFGDWQVRFLPLRSAPQGGRVQVRAELLRASSAAPVALEYSMHWRGGRWLAYDLKIDGVSLVTNYRASFAERIRRKGLDGLIADLAQMNRSRASAGPQGARDRS